MAPHASEPVASSTTNGGHTSGLWQKSTKQTTSTQEDGSRLFDATKPRSTEELKQLTTQTLSPSSCPLASSIIKNVPLYDCSTLDISSPSAREAFMTEWYNALLHGPGVLVLKKMYTDHSILDAANSAYANIISREKAAGGAKGDHFAAASTNDRIWNSFSKHGLLDPASFLSYYSNVFLALVCEAYLGPAYRVTTQVNIVHPGGKAQTCHRDYHLGFQDEARVARWPRAMHVASQLLTLQGAVAQTDMPLESGPTRLLPFSQRLEDGFMAYRQEAFREYFLANYVSVPLEKGDGLFFNPALFHAAGENVTKDFHRSANLIQVSSAYGKPMEQIDSLPLVEGTWDLLVEKYRKEGQSDEVASFVQAVAEGYPFPTNLDRRPPAPGGMAPESEQDILFRGLRDGWDNKRAVDELRQMREDSRA